MSLSQKSRTYISDEATGADGVIEAVPALVVWVLPSHEDILVSHVLGPLIDDPGPALHPDGVAAADVGAELRTVTAAFVVMTLEVLIFIEEDLQERICIRHLPCNFFNLFLTIFLVIKT